MSVDRSVSFSTVPRLLAWRASASPSAAAFRYQGANGEWEHLTWREFAAQVASLRDALWSIGLRPGDKLALISPVSVRWELLHHAALSLGAVVVGLDAHDLPARIAAASRQAGISVFAVADRRVLSALSEDDCRNVRCVIELTEGSLSNAALAPGVRTIGWAELQIAEKTSARTPESEPSPDDFATIIFTSGTTGTPKGIAYTHAQLMVAVDAIVDAYGFDDVAGRLLCWLPLSNLLQRMVNLAGMRQGTTTHLLADPRRVMDVVAQVSPDVFVGVPRFYEKLLAGIEGRIDELPWPARALVRWAWNLSLSVSRLRSADAQVPVHLSVLHRALGRHVLARVRHTMGSRIRFMVSGSAAMPVHVLESFHALGWTILEAYGISENVLPMAMNTPRSFKFGTVGRPTPGNDIRISDDGIVLVRGPGVFRGYLDGGHDAQFDDGGWYRTGDFGVFDSDGYLRLAGRDTDIIKTSTGRRVAPVGIEQALGRLPWVDQAVVVGNNRKVLVAICSTAIDAREPPPSDELISAMAQQLPDVPHQDRPRGVLMLDRPFSLERGELTPNLKLRRRAIEALHADKLSELYDLIDAERHHGQIWVVRP